MRPVLLAFAVALATGATVCTLHAQESSMEPPPCFSRTPYVNFSLPKFLQGVQLNSGMPLDVLIGYIVLDSLKKGIPRDEFNAVQKHITYNDTLKTILKYLYILKDEDPLLFEQNLYALRQDYSPVVPGDLVMALFSVLDVKSPRPVSDELLAFSSIIARVRVVDTVSIYDPDAFSVKTCVSVRCEVLDLIKGRRLPVCTGTGPKTALPASSSPCLEFFYALEHPLDYRRYGFSAPGYEQSLDAEGKPWIKAGKEYFVFLSPSGICSTDSLDYLTMRPLNVGGVSGMYPIDDNGIVFDPFDDFGFGQGLSVVQFRDALQQRIAALLNKQ